ncbi:MAG: ornithine carbamoyltransferase [Cyanobacteria bacterium HKST-UBA03]|nr:ornithine carbamoyltransferase [Cyanobacteria bacterium HKST-UBA03]
MSPATLSYAVPNLYGQSFLSMTDATPDQVKAMLALAIKLKADKRSGTAHRLLAGKHIALYFELPSNRTRVSFEVGSADLGLNTVHLRKEEINLGVRETIADTARTLSRYVDAIMIRAGSHHDVSELAEHATVPVINGLTGLHHPCQVLADLQTVLERAGALEGKTLAYIGDGNNMCHSLMLGSALVGLNMRIATPPDYEPQADVVQEAEALAQKSGASLTLVHDKYEAVTGADAVYTDVWASMTNKHEAEERRKAFAGFIVDQDLMAKANPGAFVLHCLPAVRGEEIAHETLEAHADAIFSQAENRMHAQKALMLSLMLKQ